ncbi:MAG: hypothetical protein AAGN15_03895 [Cyanobacteria bacterium J06581_3]
MSTGWQLYRANFLRYVVIALRGIGWSFLPTLLLTVMLLWILKQGVALGDFSGLSALFVPAWGVLFLWCKAQSLGWLAGISRLAYQSLRNTYLKGADAEGADAGGADAEGDDVETNLEAALKNGEAPMRSLRFTRSRRFSLLGSVVIQNIILGIVVVAFFTALFFSAGMTFAGMGMLPGSEPDVSLFFLGGGSALASIVLFSGVYVWLLVRMLLAEQSLAIEQEVGAVVSVGRSWQLTKGSVFSAACVAVLTVLISLPITLLTWFVAQSVSQAVLERVGVRISYSELSSIDFLPLTVSFLIVVLVNMLGGIIVQPLFKTVFTTLYLDQRIRKESIRA